MKDWFVFQGLSGNVLATEKIHSRIFFFTITGFFYLLGSVYKPLPDSLDYTVDWFKSGAGVPDPHSGILPSLVTVDVTNFLSAPGKLLLGTLRSTNGDLHENVTEKWSSHPFAFFANISREPVTKKKRIWGEAEEKRLRPSSERDGRIYRLAVAVPK